MSDRVTTRVKRLADEYAKLEPRPPLPAWVSAYCTDTGQIYHNARRGIGNSVPLPICVTIWEGILAAQQRDDLLAAAKAVVARWHSPLWADDEPTAEVISRLTVAIARAEAKEAE